MPESDVQTWYRYVLAALAVWRVTHLFHVEDGPFHGFTKVRALAARTGLREVFDCFYCLSLWTSLPAAYWLAGSWPLRAATWLSLSAAAILIEQKLLGGPSVSTESEQDGMLREK